MTSHSDLLANLKSIGQRYVFPLQSIKQRHPIIREKFPRSVKVGFRRFSAWVRAYSLLKTNLLRKIRLSYYTHSVLFRQDLPWQNLVYLNRIHVDNTVVMLHAWKPRYRTRSVLGTNVTLHNSRFSTFSVFFVGISWHFCPMTTLRIRQTNRYASF